MATVYRAVDESLGPRGRDQDVPHRQGRRPDPSPGGDPRSRRPQPPRSRHPARRRHRRQRSGGAPSVPRDGAGRGREPRRRPDAAHVQPARDRRDRLRRGRGARVRARERGRAPRHQAVQHPARRVRHVDVPHPRAAHRLRHRARRRERAPDVGPGDDRDGRLPQPRAGRAQGGDERHRRLLARPRAAAVLHRRARLPGRADRVGARAAGRGPGDPRRSPRRLGRHPARDAGARPRRPPDDRRADRIASGRR